MQEVNSSRLEPGNFKSLRVATTSTPGVWHVELPKSPWKWSAAEAERETILQELTNAFAFRALWLSDWASSDKPGWVRLAVNDSLDSYSSERGNGAWVVLFFAQPQGDSLIEWRPSDPGRPEEALEQLRMAGASAAIWSWYDDREWVVGRLP